MSTTILHGDCRELLATLAAGSVQTCITSPPYWGLRDYGVVGQIGNELTLGEYVQTLVAVFREVRRVLADTGTLWLNLGDAYTGSSEGQTSRRVASRTSDKLSAAAVSALGARRGVPPGLQPKNLLGLPWRVAFALQDDGWILRNDIIWEKPNCMPESVKDRLTRSHEYLFLFAKQQRYYCDTAAIAEPAQEHDAAAASFKRNGNKRSSALVPGNTATHRPDRPDVLYSGGMRNRRTVWRINTTPYAAAHFATFPEALVEPCILAGSRAGDTVLDCFGGSGTTARVAERLQRNAVLCELNSAYIDLAERRTDGVQIDMLLEAS